MSNDKKTNGGGEFVIDKPHKFVTPIIPKDVTDKWKNSAPVEAGKKAKTLDEATKELEKMLKQKGHIK
jgi:hypothetical protein